jgi:hypothetical protein
MLKCHIPLPSFGKEKSVPEVHITFSPLLGLTQFCVSLIAFLTEPPSTHFKFNKEQKERKKYKGTESYFLLSGV